MVAWNAPMCYACGAIIDNPFKLDTGQKSLFTQANDAMDREEWAKAAEFYDHLIKLRPDVSHFLSCAGVAYAFLDNKEKAWERHSRAIAVKPADEDVWQTRLEFAAEEVGPYLQIHIDEYIRYHKGSSESLAGLADSLFTVSKQHNAIVIDLCNKALNMDPENKIAMKLKKRIQKGPGFFSKLFE